MNLAQHRSLRLAASTVVGLLLATLSPAGQAQRYSFQTIAGNFDGDGGAALSANISGPVGTALDADGNLYVAESSRHRIRVILRDGTIRTVAGTGIPGYAVDFARGPVVNLSQIPINAPLSLLFDASGNLYFSDSGNNRVRKLLPDGRIVLVAGNGSTVSGGDGGRATAAGIRRPYGLALDAAGNLYIAESLGQRVRKVSPDGTISTFAGNGGAGFTGDGGPATQASLFEPAGLAIDALGNLFIADSRNHRVRKVTPAGGISTAAGGGSNGDGFPATSANLFLPYGVSFDSVGNLYVSEDCAIRKVDGAGIISSFVGGGLCTSEAIPEQVVFSPSGDAYFADSELSMVYRKAVDNWAVEPVAGRGDFHGDGGPAVDASLSAVTGVDVAANGDIYIADAYANHRIRKLSIDGTIETFAGNGNPYVDEYEGVPATQAGLYYPMDSEVDANGNVLIADRINNRIRTVSPEGIIRTFAGSGSYGFSGDGGQAANAALRRPQRVAIDALGNVFIADTANHRIRKVDANGVITTVAGNGTSGGALGDQGLATAATLSSPSGVAVDAQGNLLIADYGNGRVRKVLADGTIHTIAGNGINGFSGDGGAATAAAIGRPTGIDVAANGDLYVAAGALRKVTPSGTISTLSDLRYPAYDVAIGHDGAIYVASVGGRVLKGTPDPVVLTVPGRK